MSTTFLVKKVPVLNFSYIADGHGHIIPPECYVLPSKKIPVIFNDDSQKTVGWATVKRAKNTLFADLEVTSSMKPVTKAMSLIQKLYPAVSFVVIDSHNSAILSIRLTCILLGPQPNIDDSIKSLGDKVICVTAKTDLH